MALGGGGRGKDRREVPGPVTTERRGANQRGIDGVRAVGVPFAAVAKELGSVQGKNMVALGALQAVTGLLPRETFLAAIRAALGNGRAELALDLQAFERGADLAAELTGAV